MFILNIFKMVCNFFKDIWQQFMNMLATIQLVLLLICTVVFLVWLVSLVAKKYRNLISIALPVLLCIFTIFSTMSVQSYYHDNVKKDANEERDLRAYEKNINEQNVKINEQNAKIAELEKLKKNLEASQADIAKIEDVSEIVLLKTNFKQVKVWTGIEKDPKEDDSLFRRYNPLSDNMITKDTYLVVNNYDIPIKLGIDLNNVKVRKTGDKIQVKGITPKFIGFQDWKKTRQIREIRTYECEYAKEKNISNGQTNACTGTGYRDTDKITVHNDEKSRSLARQREDEEESKFKEAITNNNLTELEYINDIVVLKGKAYVQRILSVNLENIEFKEDNLGDDVGFVSLLDFLKNEMTDIDNKINEVKKSPAPVQLESPVSL